MDTTILNYYHYYYLNNISRTTGLLISQVKLTRLFMSKNSWNLCYIPCWFQQMYFCYKYFYRLMLMRHISKILRFLKRALWYTYGRSNQQGEHFFFINDLIPLYFFQHFSNKCVHQEFLTSSFTVFYHAYKQSCRCQEVFDHQTSCQCLDMLKKIELDH